MNRRFNSLLLTVIVETLFLGLRASWGAVTQDGKGQSQASRGTESYSIVNSSPVANSDADEGQEIWHRPFGEEIINGGWDSDVARVGALPNASYYVTLLGQRKHEYDIGQPKEMHFSDGSGKVIKTVGPLTIPSQDPKHRYDKSSIIFYSKNKRYVTVTTSDRVTGARVSRIFNYRGDEIIPSANVDIVSSSGKFAECEGGRCVVRLTDHKQIDLDIPLTATTGSAIFDEFSDMFAVRYRDNGRAVLAIYDANANLKWSQAVGFGQDANVDNVVFSVSGKYIAIAAGGISSGKIRIFSIDGKELPWAVPIPPGIYAMRFTTDDACLFGIFRDGAYLIDVTTGKVKWHIPDSELVGERDRDITNSRILITPDNSRFILATATRISSVTGKTPHESGRYTSGPDMIFTFDLNGRFHRIFRHPSRLFCTTANPYGHEADVTLSNDGNGLFILTPDGLRYKKLQ